MVRLLPVESDDVAVLEMVCRPGNGNTAIRRLVLKHQHCENLDNRKQGNVREKTMTLLLLPPTMVVLLLLVRVEEGVDAVEL